MASIFELGDIPGGLLPAQMKLAAPTATATLSAANSYNVIVRGVPTAAATYTAAARMLLAMILLLLCRLLRQ